jgi:hypothetical protein
VLVAATTTGRAPKLEKKGAAREPQIDPGSDDYVIDTLTDDAGTQLGQILVTATANAGLGLLATTSTGSTTRRPTCSARGR